MYVTTVYTLVYNYICVWLWCIWWCFTTSVYGNGAFDNMKNYLYMAMLYLMIYSRIWLWCIWWHVAISVYGCGLYEVYNHPYISLWSLRLCITALYMRCPCVLFLCVVLCVVPMHCSYVLFLCVALMCYANNVA